MDSCWKPHKPSLLEVAYDHVRHGVVIYDQDLIVREISRRARELLGIPDHVFSAGEPFENLVRINAENGGYGGTGSVEERISKRMAKAREFVPFREDQQLFNGKYVEVYGQRIPGKGYVLTYTDITSRIDAERAATDSQSRHLQLIESTNEGYWYVEPSGATVDVNPALCRILDRPRDEILGKTVFDFVDEPNAEVLRQQLERRKKGHVGSYEIALTRPDGTKVPCINNPAPIYDDDGNHIGSIGLWTSISELKQVEAELRAARDELEQRVETRTAELRRANEELTKEIAEHEKTEMALSKNEALIRALMEHAPVAISIRDLDGRYSFVSPAYANYLGLSAQEVIGKSRADVVGLETVAETEAADRAIIATGAAPEQDEGFLETFGASTLVVTKFPIKDIDERPIGIGTIGIDITAQERAEEALRKNEEYLRALIDASPSAIFLKDTEGRYIVVNAAYEEVLGIDKDEILGKTVRDLGLFDEDYVEEINAMDNGVLRTGEVVQREHHPVLPDGRTPTTMLTKFPIFGSDARPTGVGSMETDISEQKQVEQKLRDSEKRLREAQRVARLGSWDLDAEGELRWSDEVFRIFGIEQAEFDGTTRQFYERTHPEDRELVRETTDTAWASGSLYKCTHRIMRPDGEIRTVREHAELTRDSSGKVILCTGTVQDITEQVESEARLHQAQKMEAVGQLTGGVAHDFNNLLAVVLSSAEFLEDRLGPEEKFLGAIRRAATRGAELTQRLLAFSRQQPLAPRTIDLGVLVSSMSDLLIRTLGETIEIETAVAPGLWRASADQGQVENALLNLAINARDAMPGGGKLTIECANTHLDDASVAGNPEAKAGEYVVLAVSDTGSGMSAEVQAHAFEPFFTTKEVGQGSGLGLSMIYGFAQQSGGHVTIYSEEGHGTTVKLYLPRAVVAERGEGESQKEGIPRGRGEIVLVIEDDPDVGDLTVRMLEKLGYRTILAQTAAEARKVLDDEERVDLVLSDVVLPGGTSGPEFAEETRTTRPGLEFIFMSGYPADAAKRNGFLDSDKVLLNKPFRRAQLAKALHDALG